MSVARAS